MAIKVSRAAAATVKFSTPQEIVVDHADDSIKVGDGTDLATVTTVSAKKGLDSNLINANLTAPTNTTVGSAITGYDVAIKEQPVLHTYEDQASITVKYTGKTWDHDALGSAAVWQLSRETVSGNITHIEYAGDGAYDQIWNNRVTIFGTPPFANNFSVQFDGANDYVSIPHNANIDFDRLDAFSGMIWAKTVSATHTYFEKMNSNTGYRLYATSATKMTFEFRATGTGDRIRVIMTNTTTKLDDGAWHMYSWSYDGSGNASGLKFYIDGTAEALTIQNDTLTGSPSNSSDAAIGSRTGGSGNFGPGNIDEVAIWDAELSSGDMTTLYNSSAPIDLQGAGGTIEGSLISWWRMGDGDTFPTLLDAESTNDATMNNMTAGDLETEVP